MIRKLLPRSFKRLLRNSHRAFVMRKAMKTVLADPLAAVDDQYCLSALVYGWGNEGWSAENDYLRHMVRMVADIDKQEVLECGSGLSTLLLAATAAKYGGHVTSLENHPGWAKQVRSELERFGLTGASTLLVSPLRSYGAFSWYTVQGDLGPFAGVVCDGPPSTTPGGRYGLVPVMGARLSPGCRILLDDAAREEEQKILKRWSDELFATYSLLGDAKPFAEFRIPAHAGKANDTEL